MSRTLAFAFIALMVFVAGCSRCNPKVDFEKCIDAEEGIARTQCYEYAVENVNCLETCLKASNPYWKDMCLQSLAQNKSNPVYCNEIINESIRTACESGV